MCQRCFRAKHYGALMPLTIPPAVFSAYLRGLRALDVLVIKVVDVWDFHGSLIADLPTLLGDKDILLVVNKVDLLPLDVTMPRM